VEYYNNSQLTPLALATFALGLFWEAEARFGILPGVERTRVGFTGGETRNPSFLAPGDQYEALEITFRPSVVSYETLLKCFWENHNAAIRAHSRRYASAIFYHDGAQRAAAIASKLRMQQERGAIFSTEILPFTFFYQAEDHHQKYYLNRFPELITELTANRPDHTALVRSTALARVNGYLAGFGTREEVARNLASYGLSPTWRDTVMRIGGFERRVPAIPDI